MRMTLLRSRSAGLLLAVAALGIAGARAGAQDAALLADVERVAAGARADGLPTSSIMAKAAQGIQVRATRDKILSVAELERQRLTVARRILGAGAPGADLEAGAMALSVEVSPDALAAIRKERPAASIAVPIGVLTQIVATGVRSKQAADGVIKMMRKSLSDGQLLAAGIRFTEDVRSGRMQPESALEYLVRGMYPSMTATGAAAATLAAESAFDPRAPIANNGGAPATTTKPPVIKKPPFE
jgi:hypothetical protein